MSAPKKGLADNDMIPMIATVLHWFDVVCQVYGYVIQKSHKVEDWMDNPIILTHR